MRTDWVAQRKNDKIRTQMHYARQGIITEEMRHIARREAISPELVRSEVARGRMIIPANVNHPNLEPMCIGVASRCKINSNIGNSAVLSNVEEELEKLRDSVKYGDGAVFCFRQYGFFRSAMPYRDQHQRNDHPGKVFNCPVTGIGLLHRLAVKLHKRTYKIKHQTDKQLGMG